MRRSSKPRPATPDNFRVEVDWRGETAYYVEPDRRVWLECMYWGGPAGRVSHIHGVWEYPDGRREALTSEERAGVLRRVIEYVKRHHSIDLDVERA